MLPGTRDRWISTGFALCFGAVTALLLLVPSGEFVPLLPFELNYVAAAVFAAGLIILVLGRKPKV